MNLVAQNTFIILITILIVKNFILSKDYVINREACEILTRGIDLLFYLSKYVLLSCLLNYLNLVCYFLCHDICFIF